MTSACERLTHFFNPFVSQSNENEPSQERESEVAVASALRERVQDIIRFPILTPTSSEALGPQVVANGKSGSQKRKLGDTEASSDEHVHRAPRKSKFRGSEASSLRRRVWNTRFSISTPHNRACHFPGLGSQVVQYIGSFLAYRDFVFFSDTNKELRNQLDSIREITERLAFSRIPIFGKNEYKRYWGAEITDEFEPAKIDRRILRRFLKTYFGPNPLDARKLVKDTCLIPTIVPVRVMVEGRSFDYNLDLLANIARRPGVGGNGAHIPNLNYYIDSTFERCVVDKSPQEAYIQIVFPDVVGRGENSERQEQFLQDLKERTGFRCEINADVVGSTAAAFAHHAVSRLCAFGSGMEGRETYVRIRGVLQVENVLCEYFVLIGHFHHFLGDPAELDFRLYHGTRSITRERDSRDESCGKLIQWKCGLSDLEP